MSPFKTLRRNRARTAANCLQADRLRPRERPLRIEGLEPRRMLSAFDSGALSSLQSQFSSLSSTVNSALSSATGALQNLAMVGSQVAGAVTSAEASFQSAISNEITNLQSQFQNIQDGAASYVQQEVVTALYHVLGPSGANILAPTNFNFATPNSQSLSTDIHVVTAFSYPNGVTSGVPDGELEMRLDVPLASANVNLGSILQNLPIQFAPNSKLNFSANADMELAIQFSSSGNGISFPAAHLSDNNVTVPNGATTEQAQSQLMFSVNATISSGAALTAYVGVLQGNVTDTGANDGIHASVYVTSLTSPALASPAISGSANLNLSASLSLNVSGPNPGGVQTNMPSVGTTISLAWPDLSQTSGPNGPNFQFGDLTLSIGSFLESAIGSYLTGIEQTISPILDAVTVLTSPIPGLGSIWPSGLGPVPSVISLLQGSGLISSSDAQEINGLANVGVELKNLLSYLPSGANGSINFGSFSLNSSMLSGLPDIPQGLLGTTIPAGVSLGNVTTSDLSSPVSASTSYLSQIDAAGSSTQGFADTLMQGSGSGGGPSLDFPILDDPKCILNMLFGQNVDLVTFDSGEISTPTIGPFGFQIPIPVFGPISILFGAGFSFQASGEIKVGYDTQGLREFLGAGCTVGAISDLLDGVYVDPATNLSVTATADFTGGVGVSVGIASASLGIDAAFNAVFAVHLNPALADGDPQGRIRLKTLANNFSSAFVPSGDINFQLGLSLDLSFLTFDDNISLVNLPAIVLWQSSTYSGASAVVPQPIVIGYSATKGPIGGGNTITLYGINLENASAVDFEVSSVFYGSQIDGYGPGYPTPVVMDANGGATGGYPYRFIGGTPQDSGVFHTILAAVVPGSDTNTSLQFVVPDATADSLVGTYQYSAENDTPILSVYNTPSYISVTTPGGSSALCPQSYTLDPIPSVTGMESDQLDTFTSAATGVPAGGTLVEFLGSGLLDVTAVHFGDVPGIILPGGTDGSFEAYAPAGAGTVAVTVTTPGGTRSAGNFAYVPGPTVTSISPTEGPLNQAMSSAPITIVGQNFGYLDAQGNPVPTASYVLFGTQEYVTISNTQLYVMEVYVPASSVTYTPPVYKIDSKTILQASYWTVTVDPLEYPIAGPLDVRVETTPLGDPSIEFQGDSVGNWSPATSLETPPSTADVYTYVVAPTISAVEPAGGPYSGATTVVITGTDFSTATAVKFGTVPATSFTVNSDTQITATSPGGVIGSTVDVHVIGPGGPSEPPVDVFVDPDAFQYVVPPVYYGMSYNATTPLQSWGAWGPISGGTQITITGKYLSAVTAIDFGGVAGTNLTINATGTQLTVDSPKESAGGVDVKLLSLGYNLGPNTGSYDTGEQFYFEGTPTVTSVSPETLDSAGDTPMTIIGTSLFPLTSVYFVDTQDPNVKSQAVSIQYSTPTQIDLVAPSGLAEAGYYEFVEATTPGGTSAGTTGNRVSFAVSPPQLTGISPSSGPASGTEITLTGSDFQGVFGVFIEPSGTQDPHEITDFNIIDNNTVITANTGILYPGAYSVFVSNGGARSSLVSFTSTPSAYITGVSPSSGQINPGTLVTIMGVNIMPAEGVVDFGGIALTPQQGSTSGEVQVISPSPLPTSYQGTTVNIQILTNYGETPLSPADQFTYVAPGILGIASLSQTSGPVTGGTTLTITGAYLDNVTAVDFGGVPGTIVSSSNIDSEVVVTSPPSTGFLPGTVNVTVTGEYGTTPISAADEFTYGSTSPVITGVSPASVLTNTQTQVTITGSGLLDPDVYFGQFGATVLSDSYNQIVVECPASSTQGPVNVQVVTSAGTSPIVPADQFSYGTAPTIAEVGQGFGPADFTGGQSVTIIGTNLAGATAVDFGTTAATFTVENNPVTDYIEAVLPYEGPGTVNVTVTSPLGTSAAFPFTFTLAPYVDQVYPTLDNLVTGPTAGGTELMITGMNMKGATAVNLGNTVVPLTSANYTDLSNDFPGQTGEFGYLSFTTPPGAAGTVNVTVTSPEGTSSGASNTAATFTYDAPPTIRGVSPAQGGLGGGNSVTISGTGFTDLTEVYFGTVAIPFNGNNSDNSISVAAPAGLALGTVDVTAVGLGGYTSPTSPADQYTYLPPPVVSGVSVPSGSIPASGSWEGGTPVTIVGSYLADATAVDFNGSPATIVSDADDQITVISPYSPYDGPNTVDVTVTTPDRGTSATTTADQFDYTNAPFVSSVTSDHEINGNQAAGGNAGGDTVTINGYDLDGATAVNFGGTPAASFSDDGYTITAVSPPGVVGTVDITVTTPVGTSDISAADQFTYGETPTITGISPSSGPENSATQITITGTGLANATGLDFGPVQTDGYTIISDTNTQIVATTYPYSAGTYDVTVTTPYGTSATSPADQFSYEGTPIVSSLDVTSGSVYGGTLVTISGISLLDATVDFGSNSATVLSGVSTDSQLVVLSPEATGDNPAAVTVTVTTAYGSTADYAPVYFTYALPPTLTSISQTTGSTAGGTMVTIDGTNISDASAVDFGSVPAASFYSNGDGTLTAYSPAGDPSTVDVTVVTPGGTTPTIPADQFTFLAPPNVTGLSPAGGPEAGGTSVTIFGTGLTDATEVDFGGVPATGLTINADGSLTAVSPAYGFEDTFDVTVVTLAGTSPTSAADQFTYLPAPSVGSLSVSSGSRDGGDYVSIYGADLDAATAVDFGTSAATILYVSSDEIDIYSPAGAVGATVDVTVVSLGGTSPTGTQDQFSYYQAAPIVTGIGPSSGTSAGGETVTITGTDLDNASEVDFGGVAGTIVPGSDTPTQIMATVPPGTLGTVDVTVTTSIGTSGTSPADQFTGIAAPAVTGLDTFAGPTSGLTYVTVYGTALDNASAVDFGSIAGTIVEDGGTYILAQSPANTAGNVNVTVVTPYGTSTTSSADLFTFVAAPATVAASYSVTTNSTLSVGADQGVLANDSDPQGLPLTAFQLTSPANGYLAFNSDGSFSYTPYYGFVGADSFTYQATNGVAASAPVTVTFTVGLTALNWTPGASGDWTDPQWGAGASYPDATVDAGVAGAGSVVNVLSDQAANSLAVQDSGQVNVGAGEELVVTTDTSVTGGATLNVDPIGFYFTGGTFTLDTGGSVTGGPVNAGSYQLNDGTASAGLSGPGGVTVGGGANVGGTVTLSGYNSYAGPTMVLSGTLIVSNSYSLPTGGALVVGDASAFDSPLVPAATIASAVATVKPAAIPASVPVGWTSESVPSTPVLPAADGLGGPSYAATPITSAHAALTSPAAHDAVFHSGLVNSGVAKPITGAAAAAVWLWDAIEAQSNQPRHNYLSASAVDHWLAESGLL